MANTPTQDWSLKIRLMADGEIAFGPGKADLLAHIRDTGSIAAAGRAMGMSYKRAWSLVETMNNCFTRPLVETTKGGASKGGATVTELGERVLAHYRAMQEKAIRAAEADAQSFPGLK